MLRQLRESRGWSWADLARALRETARPLAITSLMHRQVSSIQRTVARWESITDPTGPGDRYQLLLAHLYAHTPGGSLALGPGSDFDTLLNALRHFGTTPQRTHQLAALVTQRSTSGGGELLALLPPATHSGVAAVLDDPSRMDHDLLSRLAGTVTTINAQVGSTPFVRLRLLLSPIVETYRQLVRIDQPPPRKELLLLGVTDAYALAARLAFETYDDGAAMSLYREASDTAERLGDRSHLAAVRTSHTMVTLHATGDLGAAREIAKAATVDAHRGASYAIRARAHAVHAEICARAGQASQAKAALDRAWKTVEQMELDDPPGGFNADRLNGFEGLCALYVGDADRAHERLSRSVASLDQSRDAVQRGIVSTDLALARLQLGDPAACVELLHGVVDITVSTRGRVSAQRIRQARHALRPWRAEDFLAELDDHIHDVLIGR